MPAVDRIRSACVCLSALVAFAWGAPLHAGASAQRWLARMAETMRVADYAGTLVYAHGNQLDAIDLVHGFIDGTVYERVTVLNGQPFEVIRQGRRIICIWPAKQRAMVARRPRGPLPPRLPRRLQPLPAQYRASVQGVGRVAGRQARIIFIDGADRYRYDYRMWIGEQTGLLLRSAVLSPGGKVLERFMFTHVRLLEGVDRERFEVSLEDMARVRRGEPDSGAHRLEDPRWRVTELPPGFRAVAHRSEAMPPHGKAVQHSVYSDGLATVSVFIEPAGSDAVALRGLTRMGAVHAFGLRVEGYQVTVIGEVPAVTVRHIAHSVERRR